MTPDQHREIAAEMIRSHAYDVEHLSISERLEGLDLPEAEHDAAIEAINDLISTATITVDWSLPPDGAGNGTDSAAAGFGGVGAGGDGTEPAETLSEPADPRAVIQRLVARVRQLEDADRSSSASRAAWAALLDEAHAERDDARAELDRWVARFESAITTAHARVAELEQALHEIANLAAVTRPSYDPAGTLAALGDIVRCAQLAVRAEGRH